MVSCGQDVTLPATGTVYGELVYDDGTPAAGVVVLFEGTRLSSMSDEHGWFTINGVLVVDKVRLLRRALNTQSSHTLF